MIQRPGLLYSVIEEMQQLEPRRGNTRPVRRQCNCRLLRNFRYLRDSNLWRRYTNSVRESLDAVMISSSRSHHQSCPLYSNCEQERTFSLNLSYCGTLLAATVRATLTMTRGAGGFSINPGLSYSRIVPSDSPAFALLDAWTDDIVSTQELQECFDRLLRQLSSLYSERKASPHDVDQYGNTALHVCIKPSGIFQLLTTLQKACHIFLGSIGYIEEEWLLVYFQFLRRLQGLGVPINKVDFEGG